MHELSIANAILDLARRHVPAGCTLNSVRVVAGPMRSIEPEAMQFAWQAVVTGVRLDLVTLPWNLRCPQCGDEWASPELYSRCACGCANAFPVGGDELQVTAIDVDDLVKGDEPCESRLSKTS